MAKLTAHDRQSHMAGSLVEIDIPLAELRKMIDALRDEELVQSVGPLIHSRGGATIHINGTKPPCRSASPANPASVTVPRRFAGVLPSLASASVSSRTLIMLSCTCRLSFGTRATGAVKRRYVLAFFQKLPR
jgi:hypothetical protein